MPDLENLQERLLSDIASAKDKEELDRLRVSAIGRKGQITGLMRTLGPMAPEDRKRTGPILNKLKTVVVAAIGTKERELRHESVAGQVSGESVDVTLAPRPMQEGRIHPVSQVTEEIIAIFADMGFTVATGPDIEDDFHNFTALNIPAEHPARQMHDTFYFAPMNNDERMLLRTHTSPVQIRHMLSTKPPYRIIAPGRTYCCDSDQTHTPMFHQVEGLAIDTAVHMGHLKGCLETFARTFFESSSLRMRFRPSYFPFTEPSAEMDIGCSRGKDSIVIGEGNDWLEILGCGMVNPRVLQHVGLDSEKYQGFAFGLGIDRAAMLKYGIPDLRAFFDSDLRWLRHYGFRPFNMPNLASGLAL